MLPKKGRREITVDGVLYHYNIRGSVSIVIRNSITGELIKFYEEYKDKWKVQFGPSEIKQIILKHTK